jgi:NosR/NirI family transcriptional regulator, nitrous oxide reductase regulator
LIFTLFFGRTFCAAVCPLGAAQEVVALRPVRVPEWLEHALGIVPYLYLGAAVLFAATQSTFVICNYDPFVAFFRLSGSINMLVFGVCLLVIGVFVGRPYCRYLCPYGAILGLLSKVSKWHATIPPDECIKCRLCEDVCPYGAIREPTVEQSPAERVRARRRLAGMLVLLPVLVVLGSWLGQRMAVPLSRLHATVRLAEQVRMEETGRVEGTTDASDAFRNTGRAAKELYAEAIGLRHEFARAGLWLGAWVGLVIGAKLIHLSVRRRRWDYQPDKAACVSCGRCFWYCPPEQARLGLIETLPIVSKGP